MQWGLAKTGQFAALAEFWLWKARAAFREADRDQGDQRLLK